MAILTRTEPEKRGTNRASRLSVNLVQWGVAGVLLLLVLFPTWPIIYQSFLRQPLYEVGQSLTLENYPRVLTNPGLWRVLGNTVAFMVGSTLLGTGMGILLAVLLTRTDIPGRRVFASMITVPYYVSALILAFAWVVMYGPQGFITVFVRSLGLPTWNLYSIGGLIVVAALYFMPLTYLYCSSSLLLADPQLENAARISGARPLRTLVTITVPLIRPAMLYSLLLTLVSGIELLSIPLVLGEPNNVDVLSTYLYRTAVISSQTDYGALAVVALMVVIFVTALVWMQGQLTKQERRFVSVSGKISRARLLSLGVWRWPAAILVGLFVILTIVVPLLGITLQAFTPFLSPLVNPFETLTLDNFRQALQFESYRISILNSLFLAAVGGFIATIFMALCALVAYRSGFIFRGAVKYLALYPRAFPGTVIGLGFLWALLSIPSLGWLRNTLWLLVIAYTMRYLPLGFSSMSPSILQISDLKEYSVALFLFARGSQVIGTTMIEEWAQGGPGPVAALALIQLGLIGGVLLLSRFLPNVKVRE